MDPSNDEFPTDDEAEQLPYSTNTPYITHMNKEAAYQPLFPGEINEFGPSFELPMGLSFSPASFSGLFFTDDLLAEWAEATNAYAASRLPRSRRKKVTKSTILRFFAIIYYMGVVRLPSKEDYFEATEDDDFWPEHPAIKLSYSMFRYMWRNFHMTYHNDSSDEGDIGRDDDVDEDFEDESDDPDVTDDPEPPLAGNAPETQPWYHKVKDFMAHVNKVSKRCCKHPGFALAIDEMMKRFKGRSREKFIMKNKPIDEGYKFYALCDSSTGFVYDFFPDGRSDTNTILDSVTRLVETIPRRDTLQYRIAMDNFFTTERVIKMTREKGVGVVGTARNRRGWPPAEYKSIDDARFNSWYVYHQDEYAICRWVDNNIVNMVTTMHTGDETTTQARRRPKANNTNRRNIQDVWGTSHVANIDIPSVINNYNHWMGGVDLADQLIAYYRPDLRCRRVWMPLLLHCLDVVRINSYIMMKSRDDTLTHKAFIKDWVCHLNERADALQHGPTRAAAALASPPGSGRKIKRRRMSHTNPTLPSIRLVGEKKDHVVTLTTSQRRCIYCSYLLQLAKSDPAIEARKPREVTRRCSTCNVNICKEHWDEYHRWSL